MTNGSQCIKMIVGIDRVLICGSWNPLCPHINPHLQHDYATNDRNNSIRILK